MYICQAVLNIICLASYTNAALRTYNLTVHSGVRAPDGFGREVYLINGLQPGPLIEADEGDSLEIFVKNKLPVDTSLHWHGILQQGTPDMDGVPGVTQYPIPPGGNFTYKFSVNSQYGFFWYHTHVRAYYNDGIRGPLLIHPSPARVRPFEKLANTTYERDALLEAERKATNILLNDWSHEPSDTIYARYLETGAYPFCVDSLLANGVGRVECLPKYMLHGMSNMGTMTMSGMSPSMTMTSLTPRGCSPPMMFRKDFNSSSLPPDTCSNTSSPLLTICAGCEGGWLALNLVNSGASSRLHVSLDTHSMFVYAADGRYVEMQEVKILEIEIGQRYSVMVRLDQTPGRYYLRFASYPDDDMMKQVLEGQAVVSYMMGDMASSNRPVNATVSPSTVWMLTNGSANSNASVLDAQQLSPFEPLSPPQGQADQTFVFTVNQTDIVTWVLNGTPYEDPQIPILQGSVSDGWKSNTTIHLPFNKTIDVIMKIADDSLDTMGHPMHLHGHDFWVLGSGTGSFPYDSVKVAPQSLINLQNPPYRDTTNLPAGGWAAIRYAPFLSDNPGAWMFHCHIQWHMLTGMAVVFVEGDNQIPGLNRDRDLC
ncbi:hypothetical protein BO78DRAFT_355831 [Aspergillus sclerotiicarbonarius CBS 121057]|uniref:Multicopper oxidase n=1 Tax=Aspergillus sclerotiicarbonarius (strain CBS 121057 / IBT 28362) TaxID=1448318 RepID=A0A319DRJ9_ASPSB|nr:hypothetical protein BO78DRAFT_355831 [Aspergillus sclerotiicarbonarius CBS 121057]